ncbi:MAG: hypothetical protein P8Y71_22565 [Pseudolabrys sp.]|jgi:hypothetical protein
MYWQWWLIIGLFVGYAVGCSNPLTTMMVERRLRRKKKREMKIAGGSTTEGDHNFLSTG